jgi:two-component system NtrC family response regulator
MIGTSDAAERAKLLVVEDDDDIREQMRWALAGDYEVYEASDRATAIEQQQRIGAPLVTLDVGLPPDVDGRDEGFSVLGALLRLEPSTKVVVITGKGDPETALGAVERGAFDFLNKPVDLDELRVILRRALYLQGLEQKLRATGPSAGEGFEGMLGTSEPMQTVFHTIEQVAGSSAPVLVLGESGTGKELVARAIHRRSARREGPFVALNCAVFPESLLESELFGHEKGTFTGAQAQRPGHFELANRGTLFLDEVGELPLAAQVKLLRFLQELVVVRVGGREEIKVDTRLIAATNVDLKRAIASGKFRADLYYRLAIVTIELPALRERRGDIVPIAEAFLQRDLLAEGKPPKRFSPAARTALESYPWPGNVRQLENHVRRATLMARGAQVTAEDLRLPDLAQARDAAPAVTTLRAAREATERELIRATLARHGGNVSRSAKELEVSRPTLHELIQKYRLKV